jgi:hypothetical protein
MVAMNTIREMYAQNSDIYLDELQMASCIFHDITISIYIKILALQETLERAGLKQKVLHKIAIERDDVRRAEFLHNIQHGFSGTGDEFVVKTGYLASRVVTGSLYSHEFFDFIVEEVVSACTV